MPAIKKIPWKRGGQYCEDAMRVPNITMYDLSRYNLQRNLSSLKDANEIMSSQKRINSMSDDPIGLSQVLGLKASVKNLEQIEKNVQVGKNWLTASENAQDSVSDSILEAKTEASRLINASATEDERNNAVERIDNILETIVSLSNTKIEGNYIFSGTDADIQSFIYNKDSQPPGVVYNGSDTSFAIKTDSEIEVDVGKAGRKVFEDEKVAINPTNNTIVFTESNGHGAASEKTMTAEIPQGLYSVDSLKLQIKNQLNSASESDGYNVKYLVEYDQTSGRFSIREDGAFNGFLKTEFKWDTGRDAYTNNIAASSSIVPEDIDLKVRNKDALTIDTALPDGKGPIRFVWEEDGKWSVENNPGYPIPASWVSGGDDFIEVDLNESGNADIRIDLKTPVSKKGEYVEFDIVSAKGDSSTGHEIGFNGSDSVYAPPVSDTAAFFVNELTITDTANDTIEFVETHPATGVSAVLSADFNTTGGDVIYTDMDKLAADIETAMEAASVNGVNYAVSYDSVESRFNIREDGTTLDQLDLSWGNSPVASATGKTLGFYPSDDTITYPSSDTATHADITIDNTNNVIAFRETSGGSSSNLWTTVEEGTYKNMAGLEAAVKKAMDDASAASGNAVAYDVAYNDTSRRFEIGHSGGGLTGLDLMWQTSNTDGNSIGETLGFDISNDTGGGLGVGTPYTGDSDMVLMTFDETNNSINFEETAVDGTVSDELSITIPPGEYTDLDDVAAEIQDAMRDASIHGVAYAVDYDYTSGRFTIKGSDANIKAFDLLWESGENKDTSAADMLGFHVDDHVSFSESDEPVVNLVVDSANNKIDFQEITDGISVTGLDSLTASVNEGTYTSHDTLAHEVEKALEKASAKEGSSINYSVTWDDYTKKFSIKENGTVLDELKLKWNTGKNAPTGYGGTGESMGDLLGFSSAFDDIHTSLKSEREVQWSIFNTLLDLKQSLSDNDAHGIERSIGRLETNYDNITSEIVDNGMKVRRLEVRETITTEVKFSFTERRSTIEDADMIKALLDLENMKTAYQASLSSTSKVINISLVDYL